MMYFDMINVIIMIRKKVCVEYIWVYVILNFNKMMWIESNHHHIYSNVSVYDIIRLIMMLLKFDNKINH